MAMVSRQLLAQTGETFEINGYGRLFARKD